MISVTDPRVCWICQNPVFCLFHACGALQMMRYFSWVNESWWFELLQMVRLLKPKAVHALQEGTRYLSSDESPC